jgi:DNA-binding NarL/FixJ family response regulator
MNPLRTFIVEDSPVVLDSLVAALEELTPVDVIGTARDEASAVQWLLSAGNACELIIIDIFLRSGSGLGVLARAAGAGVPGKRVVLSNYATVDMRDKCRLLGADRVFDKSSEINKLIAYCTCIAEGGATGPGELTD